MNGRILRRFEQDVDEGASFKALPLKPSVEYVEHAQQPLVRIERAEFHFRLEPAPRPKLLSPVQEGDSQRRLRAEMAVKTRLGAIGLGQNGLDSNLRYALGGEQLIGGV